MRWEQQGRGRPGLTPPCLLRQGGKEYLMRAQFGLPSVEAEDKEGKPPLSVKFEIPYFTTSGIQVCCVPPRPAPAPLRPVLPGVGGLRVGGRRAQAGAAHVRAGTLPEDHREEWLPGAALGAVHHAERR